MGNESAFFKDEWMTNKLRQIYRSIYDKCTFYKMRVHNKATKVKSVSFSRFSANAFG